MEYTKFNNSRILSNNTDITWNAASFWNPSTSILNMSSLVRAAGRAGTRWCRWSAGVQRFLQLSACLLSYTSPGSPCQGTPTEGEVVSIGSPQLSACLLSCTSPGSPCQGTPTGVKILVLDLRNCRLVSWAVPAQEVNFREHLSEYLTTYFENLERGPYKLLTLDEYCLGWQCKQ